MNAEWWSAADDTVLAIGSVITGLSIIGFALLRIRFVTRGEHKSFSDALHVRITKVETSLDTKVNKEDLRLLNDRLFATEQSLAQTKNQLSETNGLLRANTDASKGLERQIMMLIENELRGEKVRS